MTHDERENLPDAGGRDEGEDLEELGRWVVWLTGRYPLGAFCLPRCWHLHSEFIEEFAALHRAWQAAYAPGARPEAPLHWHEAFEHARRRLTDWTRMRACRNWTHHERRPRSEPRDPGTPWDQLDVVYVADLTG